MVKTRQRDRDILEYIGWANETLFNNMVFGIPIIFRIRICNYK